MLKALQNNKITSKTIFNCIQNLEKAGENNDITITWIPGHKGHEGNEQADLLAKKGAEDSIRNAIPTTISINLIKSKIKEWLCKKSNQNLIQSWGVRHAKHTTKNFNKQRAIKLLKLQL